MADTANQVVFHHLGGTAHARFDAMPAILFGQTNTNVLLCASVPIMTGMRSNGFAWALATTHQSGGITAMDIGPAIGEKMTMNELTPLLPHLDYLLANTHELAILTRIDKWEKASAHLLANGVKTVVIKQGAHGASVRTERGNIDVPGFAVDVHISVGAGDSFNAGFLYGVQQSWSLTEALRFANAVAAMVVSSDRGVLGSPSLSAVEKFLDEYR